MLVLLHDIEQRPIALGVKSGVLLRAACGHAGDEFCLRSEIPREIACSTSA